MKTLKRVIEKLYFKAFPDRQKEQNPHDPCLYITKREDAKHAKLLAQIVIYNETVRDMDESQLIKLLQGMMFEQMAPKLSDCIKITECEELTNPVTTTYRGAFHCLQFPDCNKIGKTRGIGGIT